MLEEPFTGGAVSHVMPAGDAVLKIQWPHRESEHEAAALQLWAGEGAVRLLARDEERHALLLERCRPGTHLREADSAVALEVLKALLPRLWKPAGPPFRPLADEAAWWAGYIRDEWEAAGRPFEEELANAAVTALESLGPTQGEQVLIHQDLHADNVLAAKREPWLAIDPKPLAGEREFALASIIRSFELGHSKSAVLGRLDTLTSSLGLDRERARGWAIGQTIAWSFGGWFQAQHVETARWLLEAGK